MTCIHLLLVVDDDDDCDGRATALRGYLAGFGFAMHTATPGTAALHAIASRSIDLVLLDLMPHAAVGLELALELRNTSRTPVILLIPDGGAADRVVALEMGADDCLSRPFEPRELVARIHSVLRRAGRQVTAAATTFDAAGLAVRAAAGAPLNFSDCVRFDGWELQCSERRLTSPQGAQVALSDAEYRLLSAFLDTPRRVVSRSQLLARARGREMQSIQRSIDQLVSRLRHKLERDDGAAALIRTVRGEGYLFDARSVQGRSRPALPGA